jgi:hypothetical protein
MTLYRSFEPVKPATAISAKLHIYYAQFQVHQDWCPQVKRYAERKRSLVYYALTANPGSKKLANMMGH